MRSVFTSDATSHRPLGSIVLPHDQWETVADALEFLAAHHQGQGSHTAAARCAAIAAVIETSALGECINCRRAGLPLVAGLCLSCRNDVQAVQA